MNASIYENNLDYYKAIHVPEDVKAMYYKFLEIAHEHKTDFRVGSLVPHLLKSVLLKCLSCKIRLENSARYFLIFIDRYIESNEPWGHKMWHRSAMAFVFGNQDLQRVIIEYVGHGYVCIGMSKSDIEDHFSNKSSSNKTS